MTTNLSADLNTTFEDFIKTLENFGDKDFTKKPAIDTWSAAEVAEHIWITNRNLIHIVKAEGQAPDRAPDKKRPTLVAALQDRQTKRIAPENVKPTGEQTDASFLIAALKEQKEQLLQLVNDTDHTQLCSVYPHPALGRLTRLEWFYFIISHTERHRQQLLDLVPQVK